MTAPESEGIAPCGWRFFIDRGGTFTDVVARAPDGRLVARKLLSENPEHYDDPVSAGIREVLGLAPEADLSRQPIAEVRIGTTLATNALLERRGEPTVLVITRGFGDALRIGYQNRPEIFALRIVRPPPLYARVIEADERISADGRVLRPLDLEAARAGLEAAHSAGLRAAAVALLHAYRYPEHERALAALAREIGFAQVSTSHETIPLIRLVRRADTTVADAYLTPVLRRYVGHIAGELGATRLVFMQSSGGLAEARHVSGKNAVLSGPAGGIVGAARAAAAAGFPRIIAFDMGGTSTDVAHFDGAFERTNETEIGGVRLQAPMMRIHSVAAGGGSKIVFDGARFRVGPESAGADPGPACYRRGGPLTITDCNVTVGKIRPEFFPPVFGPRRDLPLDAETVRARFAALAEEVSAASGSCRSPEEVAEGFLAVAVENMANAIKRVSVARGRDVTRYTLCCFGGAGPQHACLVADALGMSEVLVPRLAGVLSAFGIGAAELRALKERSVELDWAGLDDAAVARLFAPLEEAARAELRAQGATEADIALSRRLHLRYRGADTALALDHTSYAGVAAAFSEAHRARFGFAEPGTPLVLATVEVEAVAQEPPLGALGRSAPPAFGEPAPAARVAMFNQGRAHATPVYLRDRLPPGFVLDGPAIIAEELATTVVEPGWRAEVRAGGDLVLSRKARPPRRLRAGAARDPVMLEIFDKLFMAAAERMGAALANTAHSVNIKERLDFSCAVFDGEGNLVANAPHMPVHLGSMGESVAAVIGARKGRMRPGDAFATNAPYRGGTHLPDITVVSPVFADGAREPAFFVAARGHHADVGGISPGSMPPESRTIAEEGVLIEDFHLVAEGRFREAELRALLARPPWPARNPDQNVADLKAQVAANTAGARELEALVREYSLPVVRAYMGHVQDNAEESVRRAIARLGDGEFRVAMDDGSVIAVRVRVDRAARAAVIDFSGTSPQRPNNLNAPLAVTRAAVLYVFRTLVPDDIPLNAGCLRPLTLIVPEGSMLNPRYPAAVVAGNVETSQWVTDALLAALGEMAASQGTMNNFTFGDARYQYYETVCGGAGAGRGFAGADAVHTHMTNSRLTDPEVLESRFPVLVEEFAVREGSGGDGRWPGGCGAVRRIRFLSPMTASILSTRRTVPPFGLAGGEPGKPGRNYVIRADGRIEELAGTASVAVAAGDQFVIETPGGGGYGAR